MGNTPSLEAPRRPQKLSKPPLCLQPPDTALLDPGAASTPPHGRFSKSYLVGSVPIAAAPPFTPASSSPVDPKDPLISVALTGDEIDIPLTPPTLRIAPRPADIRRWSSVSRTTSFHSDFSQRRSSSMVFTDSRPNSVVTDYTRPESLVSLGRRGSVNYDVRNYEAQRLMTLERDIRRESMVTDCESYSPNGDITENTWKSSHPAQPDSSPVTRTNSDVSLYMRVRRRSIIQTPGVATRAQPSENSFSTKSSKSTKSSSRSSVTATPDETRHNSIESEITSHSPDIPEIIRSEPLERVVTPCEGQYKQLGGIEFGSLRVVNVSPQPSPRPSSDQEREESISPRDTSPPSYFDPNAPSSAMIAPLPTDQVPTENAAKSLFKNPFGPTADPILENSHGEVGSLPENGSARAYVNAEILDVRDDPNAKPTAERIRRELESKTLRSLSRSDSGFVSSPSSEGSRKRISKADSGYSSNVSLRSLRSLKSAVTDLGRKSPEKAPESLNSDKPGGGLRAQIEPKIVITPSPAGSKKANETITTPESTRSSKSASYRSLTSIRRGSMLSMASLSSSKTREFEPLRPRSRSSPGRPPSQESASAEAPSPTKTIMMANSRSANNRRLQRILSGSQRRGPPKVRDNRSGNGGLLLSPNHANTRGRGNAGSAAGQYRPFLRDERSKDTLRTIMSVGSTDVLGLHNNNTQEAFKDVPKEAAKEAGKESLGEKSNAIPKEAPKDSKPERPPLLTRRRNSLRAATRSVAQAAAALFSSDKSPSSKSSKDTKSEDGSQKINTPESAHARRPSAAGSVNQLPARYRNRNDPNRQSFSRPSSANPVPSSPKPQDNERLGSISSQTKKPKSGPPVSMPASMRTRSVKIPPSYVPGGPSSPLASDAAPARRRSLPRDLHREYAHNYLPAQPGVGVYGMPLAGAVPVNNQQMLGFVGHQTMPTRVGSGLYVPGSIVSQPMVSPVAQPVTQPGHNRRHSMPVPGSRPNPAMVRGRSTASPQPQMQSRQGASRSHIQPGPNGHVLGYQAPLQHFPQPLVQSVDFVPHPNSNVAAAPRPNITAHRRASSHGSLYGNNPPFRVLHSYNSPAYRGVPIWG